MITSKTLAIVNPVSGGVDKDPYVKKVKEVFENVHIIYTKENDNEVFIKKEVSDFSPENIVILGGDGSLKLLVDFFGSTYNYYILPLGSANGMCNELNIPKNPELAISSLKGFTIRGINTLKLNDTNCIHLADFGFNADIIKDFSDTRGMWGYFLLYLKNLYKFKSYKFIIDVGDKKIAIKSVMLVIANGKFYGTGLEVNPLGSIDDNLVDIIVFKPFSLFKIPFLLIKMLFGKVTTMSFVKHYQIQECTITNPDNAPFQIDGEPQKNTSKVHICVNKNKVNIYSGNQ